jgi:hypothetical protein
MIADILNSNLEIRNSEKWCCDPLEPIFEFLLAPSAISRRQWKLGLLTSDS